MPPSARSGSNRLSKSVAILACAATDFECETWPGPIEGWTVLATGVGCVSTMLALSNAGQIEAVVSLGIAGAYADTGLAIGDVVLAQSEVLGDLGMELPGEDRFRALSETPFGGADARVLPACVPSVWIGRIPAVPGCTVSCCTGTASTGAFRRDRFQVRIETMEGAACAAFALSRGIPYVGIRAISNIAADRDMRPENIRRALEALRSTLVREVPALAGTPVSRW